jgi:hypothetical protein
MMAQLVLTSHEVMALLEILQSDQSDLRMEIANTDRMEFRDQLKETKMVTQSIIEKLQRSLQEEEQNQRAQRLT